MMISRPAPPGRKAKSVAVSEEAGNDNNPLADTIPDEKIVSKPDSSQTTKITRFETERVVFSDPSDDEDDGSDEDNENDVVTTSQPRELIEMNVDDEKAEKDRQHRMKFLTSLGDFTDTLEQQLNESSSGQSGAGAQDTQMDNLAAELHSMNASVIDNRPKSMKQSNEESSEVQAARLSQKREEELRKLNEAANSNDKISPKAIVQEKPKPMEHKPQALSNDAINELFSAPSVTIPSSPSPSSRPISESRPAATASTPLPPYAVSDVKTSSPVSVVPVVVVKRNQKQKQQQFDEEDDDDEEEDDAKHEINEPLTTGQLSADAKLSKERETWKVCPADLHRKRPDYHGAVVLAFGGVFAVELYDTVEVSDEFGKIYTEYMFRCQWGPDWDTIQPWVIGRRYREFDQFYDDIMDRYDCAMIPNMPPKEIFNNLAGDVIEKRKNCLSRILYYVVNSLPIVLSSAALNEFLQIYDRITAIKEGVVQTRGRLPNPTLQQLDPELGNASSYAENRAEMLAALIPAANIMTSQEAEQIAESHMGNADQDNQDGIRLKPFSSDGLGYLEERVRDLIHLVACLGTHSQPSQIANLRAVLLSCMQDWPRLKVTMKETDQVRAITILSRAMQCDEDLNRAFDDYKSCLAAFDLYRSEVIGTSVTIRVRTGQLQPRSV